MAQVELGSEEGLAPTCEVNSPSPTPQGPQLARPTTSLLMDPAPPGGAAPRAPSSSGLDPTHASLYVVIMRRTPHVLGLRVGCGQRRPRAAGSGCPSCFSLHARPGCRRLVVASAFMRLWPPRQCNAPCEADRSSCRLRLRGCLLGGAGLPQQAPARLLALALSPRTLARLRRRSPGGPRAHLGACHPHLSSGVPHVRGVCVFVCVRSRSAPRGRGECPAPWLHACRESYHARDAPPPTPWWLTTLAPPYVCDWHTRVPHVVPLVAGSSVSDRRGRGVPWQAACRGVCVRLVPGGRYALQQQQP